MLAGLAVVEGVSTHGTTAKILLCPGVQVCTHLSHAGGGVSVEVHLLRQLQHRDVMLIARGLVLLVDMDTGHLHHPLGHTGGGDVVITQPHLHQANISTQNWGILEKNSENYRSD